MEYDLTCCSVFVQRGRPYKMIKIHPGDIYAMDMLTGELIKTKESDPVCNTHPIWLGELNCYIYPTYFEAYDGKLKNEYTVYFNEHYRLHREDGPAFIKKFKGGATHKEYWLDGVHYGTAEDWFNQLSDKKKALFNLDEIKGVK